MTKGERIRALREKIGKSQVELAEIIGVSKQTLYKYENNIIANIPSDKIEAIAKATLSTPAFIMGWDSFTPFPEVTRTLSPDEAGLLDKYQVLNQIGKKKVHDFVSDLSEMPKYKEDIGLSENVII